MLISKKTVDGYLQLYRTEEDDWVTLDEDLLGIIGLVYSNGYVGSSIFVDVFWNDLHSTDLKHLVRVRSQREFQITKDTEGVTSVDMRGIRSQLQELGMEYKLYDLLPLKYLEQENQILAFVKGYMLGVLTQEMLVEFNTTGNLTFHVKGSVMWEAILELLELVTVPYLSDVEEFTITLLAGEGSKNTWFLNQKTFMGG